MKRKKHVLLQKQILCEIAIRGAEPRIFPIDFRQPRNLPSGRECGRFTKYARVARRKDSMLFRMKTHIVCTREVVRHGESEEDRDVGTVRQGKVEPARRAHEGGYCLITLRPFEMRLWTA